jgi:CHASE2 domain-containing sensor protein
VVLFGSEAPSLRDFFNVPSGHALEGHRKIPGSKSMR